MQHRIFGSTILLATCLGLSGLCGLSCHSSDEPITFDESYDGKAVSVRAGSGFEVSLGTVGPAYFVVPPTLSSDCLRFLGESDQIGEPNPGGYKTQVFRFQAVSVGQADISIAREIPALGGFSLTVQVY